MTLPARSTRHAPPAQLLWLLLAAACPAGVVVVAEGAPRTLYWEADHLQRLRRGDAPPSETVARSLRQLQKKADAARKRGPYSVVDKTLTPASGDKHDYASYGRYWWPNPETEDGLPYVRRDGQVNRAMVEAGDRVRLAEFCDDAESLALAAYLLDDRRAAEHAALLVRTWFLDPATRMTPRVRFGQAVPGRTEGRGAGVLDTRNFVRVLDAVALLEEVGALADDEIDALRGWFDAFADWLVASPIAQDERDARNNHGTWYAAQLAGVACFAGRDELAQDVVRAARDERLAAMIEPDGAQPEELRRTLSLHYCVFNLEAFFLLARIGERFDIDLWGYETADGASLRRAFDFAARGVASPAAWPYEQIKPFTLSDRQYALFLLAASRWRDANYCEMLRRAPGRYGRRHLAPLMFATAAPVSPNSP